MSDASRIAPDRSVRLARFTVTERVLHWTIAIAFFVMLGTGAALYFPAAARFMDRPTAKDFHLWAAIAMAVATVLVPLLGNRRSVLGSMREVQYLDQDDVAWLKAGPARQLARRSPVPQGRFNAGQKLNTAMMSGGMAIIYVTGFLLWYGERDTRWRLLGSVPVHDLFSVFLVLLVVGHVYLAVIHPATRAAMRGMIWGDVDRDFAEHHHATWVAQVDAAEVRGVDDDPEPEPDPDVRPSSRRSI